MQKIRNVREYNAYKSERYMQEVIPGDYWAAFFLHFLYYF